eukprot:gnl/MRDRNA2_/MRDRNA2_48027_c0_seq1.p1 gnl/MRDRNA2_/MRDRNA2_48027_c0~~gnl/MRDRNA2_/MRDRNA2_48027_c0_seq1.p1  ORF type:complete len:119 (+),score=29.05 gnl/MRDRNA2_/MRDRNA2_48027_c0_seq1:101-457(+)
MAATASSIAPNEIQVNVTMMDGSEIICQVEASGTVLDLKKAISKVSEGKFQVSQQMLMVGRGLRMRNSQLLSDYRIKANSSVTMVIQAVLSEEEERQAGAKNIQSIWKRAAKLATHSQ